MRMIIKDSVCSVSLDLLVEKQIKEMYVALIWSKYFISRMLEYDSVQAYEFGVAWLRQFEWHRIMQFWQYQTDMDEFHKSLTYSSRHLLVKFHQMD